MASILAMFASFIGGLVIALFLFWRLWFLRDPDRKIPTGDVVISPADGKIVEIREVNLPGEGKKGMGIFNFSGEGLENPALMISIFMSPLNVHVNRAPISGKVKAIRYHPGSFLHANSKRANENESNELIIEGDGLTIGVVQVAGMLARRIECFVKEGAVLEKGERFGLINLGSRVCVLLPPHIRPAVAVGDHVLAGESVLARLGEN